MDERLQRQLDFSLEIDKEKNITRQTHLSGRGRAENDAEHAWHMAIERVMIMCLVHDLVEIDAGDTYAYDDEGLKTQKEREEKAKERIFGMLPDDQCEELNALFEEFEANETPESRFAHTMDNLQPLILNNSNDGGDWVRHGVNATHVLGRQRKSADGSEFLYKNVIEPIVKDHIAKGHIKDE